MKINRQAGWRTRGRFVPLALVVSFLVAPAFAAGHATGITVDSEEPFTAMNVAFRSATMQSGLRATANPGVDRPLLPARRDVGFIGRHLAPRLAHQMGQMVPIHALESHRALFERSEMHSWFAGTAGHFAGRGTRKAVRDYLIEETGLGALVESVRVRHRRSSGAPAVETTSVDLGVGISRGRPRLEMGHRSHAGLTRVRVDLDGSVSVVFVPAGAPASRLVVAHDRSRSLFGLAFRHSF